MRWRSRPHPNCAGPGAPAQFGSGAYDKEDIVRSILLWLLGVPIPIIILIALFWH